MGKQPTNQEILEAINKSFSEVEQRLGNVEQRLGKIEITMVTKSELKSELAKFETRMVSKEFFTDTLDGRLFSLRNELLEAIRKGDKKLSATLDLLVTKKIITKNEAAGVLVV